MGLLGLIALVIGLLQVIGRYFDPARAISYAEEVIVYLIIWAIMIVSSQLVRRDGHVRPDLVLRLLPPRYLRIVEIFNCLVAIVFCGALVWYGWEIVDTSLLIDETSSTDLQFPMWIYYLALPVGSALMLVRYLMRLVRFTLYFDPATMTVGQLLHGRDAERAVPAARRPLEAGIAGPHHADPAVPGAVLRAARRRDADLPGARHVRRHSLHRHRPAADRRGADGDQQAQLDDPDGAAAVRDGGRLHALGRRRQGAGRCRHRLARRHQGLARPRHRGGVHAVRGDLRLQRRDRAGDGHHPGAGDDRARLSPFLCARRGRRVRHHRHRGAAESRAHSLRHRRRAIGAAAVSRRRAAGPAAGRGVRGLGAVRRAAAQLPGRAVTADGRRGCASPRGRSRRWRCRWW